VIFLQGVSFWAFADHQELGPKAVRKYFVADQENLRSIASVSDRALWLHLGQYTDSQAYQWGTTSPLTGVGQGNYGITYLFDQWHSMDLSFRADFSEYSVQGVRATQLALMPLVTFPRIQSSFPLYFGVGIGPGIFLQQANNASNICLDYEVLMGLRFMQLAGPLGFFVEFGLKNSLFVLSQGQFNGTVFDLGLIFNF